MKTWRIGEPGRVSFADLRECHIDVVKGSVDVVAGDDEPGVEVTALRGGPMQVTQDGEVVRVGYPKKIWRLPIPLVRLALLRKEHADITVTVPPTCHVTVRTVDATVTVTHLDGRLTVDSVCGDVNLAELGGPATVATGRGLVQAVGAIGDLDVDIHAGDFMLVNGSGARVRARSVHGSHRLDLGAADGARDIDVSCRVGDVIVRVPTPNDLAVELTTVMGQVSSDLDGVEIRKGRRGATGTGRFGAGAGRLRANADRGRVSLLGRPTEPAP